jgi:hypothetical protein
MDYNKIFSGYQPRQVVKHENTDVSRSISVLVLMDCREVGKEQQFR